MNCERRVYDPEMKRVMRIMIVAQQDINVSVISANVHSIELMFTSDRRNRYLSN